jgi:hypothetical protein
MRLALKTLLAFILVAAAAPAAFAQDNPQTSPPAVEQPVGPAAAPSHEPTKPKIKVDEPETAAPEAPAQIGIGARFRYIFLPASVLNLFLGHATSMSSVAIGGEVIRRKGNLDIVFGLEYANISPANGLYLEKGKNPALMSDYPDYVTFDNFSMVSVDGTFIWHADLAPFMQFRYGAGIGIGFLLGDIKKQKGSCPSSTTPDQLDNPHACDPVSPTVRLADKPPVVPIVNLLVGLRFKIVNELSANVEIGFRDVFFSGVSLGYFF